MSHFHGIASIASGLLTLCLGLAVFLRHGGSSERRIFSVLCLTMSWWLTNYGFMELSSNESHAFLFAKLGHSSVIFAPIVYLHFTRYVLNLPQITPWYRAYYCLGVIFLYFLYATDLFIPAVVKQPWGFYPVGGIAMLIDALILTVVALACWTLFIMTCRRAKARALFSEHNRLVYCCVALTIFSLGALDYLPKFGIPYYPLGFATNAFFVSVITYAILVHNLMDIKVVIRKSLIYTVLIAIITAVYFLFVFMAEKQLQGVIGYRSLLGSLVAGFIIALGFTPLKEFIQRFVDTLFFQGSQPALAAENERLRQELTRSEKLKAVATLAAGMAHEIKNPLSSIKTFAEFLPQRYEDPSFREKFAKVMSQEVDKINHLVQRLLDFARPAQPHLESVRLSTLVKETVDVLHGSFLKQQVRVETRFADQDTVCADAAQMKQVILNLLLNSLEAIDPPGQITVSTVRNNGHLDVVIADTGHGIPRKDFHHIFDPFYTTKPSGTGLGLSVVHSIVREHGGRVRVESVVGQGTTVRVSLPLNGRD